jgi:hypothetical protein
MQQAACIVLRALGEQMKKIKTMEKMKKGTLGRI